MTEQQYRNLAMNATKIQARCSQLTGLRSKPLKEDSIRKTINGIQEALDQFKLLFEQY